MTAALAPLRNPVASADTGLPTRLALAAVAGALLAGGYALHPLWWAPWLAAAPLVVAGSGSARHARLAGAVAGAGAMTSVLPYYLAQNGWAVTVLIALLRMGGWGLALRSTEAAARRLPLAVAMLVLPATVAGTELLTLLLSPHGAAGSLAYSQMDQLGVIQVAALGGVPAIVFLVLLPGSLAGLWLSRPWPRAERLTAALLLAALALAAAFFAFVRVGGAASGPSVPVTLIASDQFERTPKDWAPVWAHYQPAVLRTAVRGGLVVLPEKIALLDPVQAAQAADALAATARATGATLVVGIELQDGRVFRNRALVAAPDGGLAGYDKRRIVPGFEARDTPGKTPLFVRAAGARLGVAICKDMHVPTLAREYAGGAAIMTVPAWDFGEDGWMGARMTALRGVENGYAVARSAREGFVGAYDRTGRALVERQVGPEITIASARLPAYARETLYGRFGDVFGWLCVAAVTLLLVWTRLSNQRARALGQSSTTR